MMTPAPVSVIIPCFRDETALGELLAQLQQLTVGTPPASAGGRWGAEPALPRHLPAAWRAVAARPALQRGAAAPGSQPGAASGSVVSACRRKTARQSPAGDSGSARRWRSGGYFAFRFAGQPCWQSRLLERLIALRNIFGVPYGDQGLFFDSSTYQSSGQHSPWPLFEEVELIKHARLLGRLAVLPDGVRVDARRWQRDGWWRRSLRNRWLALGYFFGVSPQRLAQRYSTVKASEDRTKS